MTIDIHTHIMPEVIPNWFQKFGYGEFITLEHHKPCCARMIKGDKLFREIKSNCWDAGVRLSEMDDTRVAVQVLSPIPVLFNYWAKPQHTYETARYFNDHIAGIVAEHPSRFIGLGTVPMQDVDYAIRELERCIRELGMPGIEIGSNINNKNLSDPYLLPFWEAAQDLDAAIFVHPWEMMGMEDMRPYWLPWLVGMPAETSRAICSLIFSGVLEKFPRIRFAFAHGGGSFPATLGRIEHGFKVRPDLVAVHNKKNPREYIGRFWIDSLVHDAAALDFVLDIIGEDHICCGSDYPFPLGEHRPGSLVQEHIQSAAVREKILYKNAQTWLGGSFPALRGESLK